VDQILVYADSLSWGIVPNTRRRLPFAERWPGVMEGELLRARHAVRVIEDCLNGRRTAWEDPYKPGRNGLAGIEQRIEAHSPLALVVLMLGTNDFQSLHAHSAWHSAEGIAALVRAVRHAPLEPGMPVPEVLVVAPPPMRSSEVDGVHLDAPQHASLGRALAARVAALLPGPGGAPAPAGAAAP
jgi:lysophospholipase L1-like esterase